MGEFIGRTREIGLLQNTVNNKDKTISIIYGRRRVGKSQLIRTAFAACRVYYFEGLENQGRSNQILNFLAQLSFQTRKDLPQKIPVHWRDVFREVPPFCAGEKTVIVFDEFQWMANYRTDIISDLKMAWEQYFPESAHLVLCGSIASFMVKKVIRSRALYGRTDLEIHLRPFSIGETARMLAPRSEPEIFEAHMLVGGIPKYLELMRPHSSVQSAMQELAFTPHGYFTEEYNRIFVSHFGSNNDYLKIVECLSTHAYGLTRTRLSALTKIQLGGGLTNQLYNLEMAGFIQSYQPFDKEDNSNRILYCLKDAYLRFYFAFIKSSLKKIAGEVGGIFQRLSQTQAYFSWLGRAFEYLCMDHANRISEILGFSGIDYAYGPYFAAGDKNKKGMQIDLVFDRADHVLNLCEIKYTARKLGLEVITDTERKVALLESKTRKTIQKILITRVEPSPELANRGYFYRIIRAGELLEKR